MSRARYDLEDRLVDFAVQICTLTDRLPPTPIAKHVSTQVTRSGTSPLANYGEAQAAESRQDFVHNFCPEQIGAVREECNELVSILVASARTARANVKMSNVQ